MGYNVVIINIDTLRADHLGCYGYRRNTSPFIDSLAARGVLFEEARSNSSYTRESVAVLMSGRLPSRSGSIGWDAAPSIATENLAELFAHAGYRTGFFSATTVLTGPLFTKGFDTVQQLTDRWGVSGLGTRLSARAVDFADATTGHRFLMYLHYLDPHGPYDPPQDLYLAFAGVPFPTPLNLYKDVRPNLAALLAEGFGPGDPRFEDMVTRYDAEIADTDRAVAQLFAGLQRLGVLDHTLVIVTADHGEEFLEHGFVEHAWTLYDEVLRVPLLFWAPSALPQAHLQRRAMVVDILPTVLHLTGTPNVRRDFDGEVLFDASADQVRPTAPAKAYIGELLIAERNVARAVIDGDWKYVAALKWLPPEIRPAAARVEDELRRAGDSTTVDLKGPIVREELYDLAADPRELHDACASNPQVCRAMSSQMQRYVASSTSGLEAQPHPHDLSPEDRQRLRALGYVQ